MRSIYTSDGNVIIIQFHESYIFANIANTQ